MTLKSFTAVGAIAAASMFNAFSGQQVLLNGTTNWAVSSAANTYALYGDSTGNFTNGIAVGSTGPNSFIDASKSTSCDLAVGGQYINTTATNITWTFTFAASEDLANWTNTFYTVTYVSAATTTNTAVSLLHLGNAAGANAVMPAAALRSITASPAFGSTNQYVTNIFVKGFTKTGI